MQQPASSVFATSAAAPEAVLRDIFAGDIVFKDPCADLLPCFVAVEINVRGNAGLSLRDRYAYTMLYHALRA
jgi:hypothetical protein